MVTYASNRVYATVEQTLPESGYCFARAAEGLKVFTHFSRARTVERRPEGLWLTNDVEKRQPKVGDQLFMVIEHADRGYRARYWGYDPEPRAWNYLNLIYRRWPEREPSAIIAFSDFLRLMRRGMPLCKTFRADYLASVEEQAFVSRLADAYANERVRQLVEDGRPHMAIAELEMLSVWRHGLKLDINVQDRLALLTDKNWTDSDDELENLIKRMRSERDAGRPHSARLLFEPISRREHEALDRHKQKARRAPAWSIGRGEADGDSMTELSRRFRPISLAFEEEPALVNLHKSCTDAAIKLEMALRDKLREAVVVNETAQISAIWRQYHDADQHFDADHFIEELVNDWVLMGLSAELHVLAPLLSERKEYDRALGALRRFLPADHRPLQPYDTDRFYVAAVSIERALAQNTTNRVLPLYEAYIVQRGASRDFCGLLRRERLVQDLRAQAPLDELDMQCGIVLNDDRPDGETAAKLTDRILAATPEMRAHKRWPEVRELAFDALIKNASCWSRLKDAFPIEAARFESRQIAREETFPRDDGDYLGRMY